MRTATRHSTIGFIAIALAMAGACLGNTAIAAAPMQSFSAETALNVGKTLPADATALNDKGQRVKLRDVLRGPAILIKTEAGCPPCTEMIDYLRKHGVAFARAHHVQLVVYNTASGFDRTGQHYPRNLPASIPVLHVTNYGMQGFLGGKHWPTTFFFDKNLKLIGKNVALSEPVETNLVLAPPAASASK